MTLNDLARIIEWMDADLDGEVPERYRDQPLAQDWARVAKVTEEAGEAIDALIGMTGQNPRKGEYGTRDDLLTELADVALTGLYAIQHFTKDADDTLERLFARAAYHRQRRAEQITEQVT
jgi:NTP pyrophosphatase (non-canonical NTP hydrolase)